MFRPHNGEQKEDLDNIERLSAGISVATNLRSLGSNKPAFPRMPALGCLPWEQTLGCLPWEQTCVPTDCLPWDIQGYLAHKKQPPLRTLQQDYAQGPMVVLGGVAVSYERGTPVGPVDLWVFHEMLVWPVVCGRGASVASLSLSLSLSLSVTLSLAISLCHTHTLSLSHTHTHRWRQSQPCRP